MDVIKETKIMGRITLPGPFYQVTIARIDKSLADQLLDGSVDKVDFRYEVQSNPTWQSVYGADGYEFLLDGEPMEELAETLMESAENSGDVAVEMQKVQYPEVSVYLDERSPEEIYFICREICEGEENYEFQGEFDPSKLSLKRVSVWADDEICDVFQLRYEGATISDETESSYDAFFIYERGTLTEIE
jgi:hypothetical protein